MVHIKHKNLLKGILCFFVAFSFFATLAPLVSASKDAMPCCVGKAAGHCDSGIAPKPISLPKSEPMCGLDNSGLEDDAITIVAEPSHSESHNADAAESASVSKPCQMECSACASASSRQQKRERAIAEARGRHTSPSSSVSRLKDLPLVFTSNENWPRIIPRGPPASL